MRKKVISHKEAHEDPVINAPLNIKCEWKAGHGELSFQILQPKWNIGIKAIKGILVLRVSIPMIMTTYLTKNIKTKKDKLSLCARKTICKFIVLQERDQD